jgi:hypothetical protein
VKDDEAATSGSMAVSAVGQQAVARMVGRHKCWACEIEVRGEVEARWVAGGGVGEVGDAVRAHALRVLQ